MPTARVFASLRQVVGDAEITIDASTLGEFLAAAADRFGEAFERQIPHCTVVINDEKVTDPARAITADDKIAILPPVAGGSGPGGSGE